MNITKIKQAIEKLELEKKEKEINKEFEKIKEELKILNLI